MVSTERIYTAAEQQAMAAFEQQEAPKGLISSDANAQALLKYLGDTVLTVQSIQQAVDAHVAAGWKMYSTPQELAYKNATEKYSQHDIEIFENWFSQMGRHLIVDLKTPQGLQNAISLLEQMAGKEFNHQRLTLELQRAFSGRKEMYVTPTTQRAYSKTVFQPRDSAKDTKEENERTNRPFLSHADRYRS